MPAALVGAEARVYSDYFLDPFDDESPQDKTNCEEKERSRPSWRRLKRPSGQVAV